MKTKLIILSSIILLFIGIAIASEVAESDTKIDETFIEMSTIENESDLELECWMINDDNWEVEKEKLIKKEQEESLKLESWMIEESVWY